MPEFLSSQSGPFSLYQASLILFRLEGLRKIDILGEETGKWRLEMLRIKSFISREHLPERRKRRCSVGTLCILFLSFALPGSCCALPLASEDADRIRVRSSYRTGDDDYDDLLTMERGYYYYRCLLFS